MTVEEFMIYINREHNKDIEDINATLKRENKSSFAVRYTEYLTLGLIAVNYLFLITSFQMPK